MPLRGALAQGYTVPDSMVRVGWWGGLQGACSIPWQEELGVIHREQAWVWEGGRGIISAAMRCHSSNLPT